MGLTDCLRKVQQFKELDWKGLLKPCDILLEQSGKTRGLVLEQCGKTYDLLLEQSGKSEQFDTSRDFTLTMWKNMWNIT